METMVPYAIYLVLALVGLGMVAIVLFGIRNLSHGKVNPSTIVLSGIPMVLLVVLGFALGDWAVAGVYTFLISLVLTTAALLLSGVKGLFG
ncbi:MAG: hypothetical protein JJ896_13250 [Rhodothermales bacterium]|nr:hypothetical protein [Rhodothermales bacterium]MBO6780613.1 hypothetical protein [Rhodothermales bacterium]